MAIAPRPIAPISGVPVFRNEQEVGVAPAGYAPGTVVQLLGQQLMTPPAPVQSVAPIPVPQNVFRPFNESDSSMDAFDSFPSPGDGTLGELAGSIFGDEFGQDVTDVTDSIGKGFGSVVTGLADALTDFGRFATTPMFDMNLPGTNFNVGPSPLGVASLVVPSLGPLSALNTMVSIANAIDPPVTNSLGQTNIYGTGNENIDMFGNVVGSPENIAQIASYSIDQESFVDSRGEPMSPAPSPDVYSPDDFSFTADQTQAADPDGPYGDTYGESTADGGGGDGGGDTVICTELHRQGRLGDEVFRADREFGAKIIERDPYTMKGYHCWAKRVVKLMQKSCLFTCFIAFFALPWAREMYRRETGRGRGSLRGKILMKIGIPLCRFIGKRNAHGWLPPFGGK